MNILILIRLSREKEIGMVRRNNEGNGFQENNEFRKKILPAKNDNCFLQTFGLVMPRNGKNKISQRLD